uniref:Uncharacterized protein n=1 Tax=Mycena chlorophos TaxID=658473 RepID=A0ABQ0LCL3_MYCCL|nr:predicted protein [Mycena chlorophos]
MAHRRLLPAAIQTPSLFQSPYQHLTSSTATTTALKLLNTPHHFPKAHGPVQMVRTSCPESRHPAVSAAARAYKSEDRESATTVSRLQARVWERNKPCGTLPPRLRS